jgi:ADP-ribose pyrophosphatase
MADKAEILLTGRKFRVERRIQTTPDGQAHEREIVVHPGAVTILPILPDGRVCLIRNYRVAVEQTLIELPAGTLDANEDPAAAAHRELIEETGYQAGRLERLCEFYMSPGILNERMIVFAALDLQPGKPALEPGEEIETYLVSWDEALRLIAAGEIRDSKTIAALLYYDRFRTTTDFASASKASTDPETKTDTRNAIDCGAN